MSRKRRNTSSPEPDDSPPPKRTRLPDESLYHDEVVDTKEQPRLHEGSGQVGAFPGLGGVEEEFYGPALDGVDYLRMVRSEARGVPALLRAGRSLVGTDGGREGYEAGIGEGIEAEMLEADDEVEDEGENGWTDGVYTARATKGVDKKQEMSPGQIRYYEVLLAQFRAVQATMRCTPPIEAVKKLGYTPISLPIGDASVREVWKKHIAWAEPNPVQLACMDLESVWQVLDLLVEMIKTMRRREKNKTGAIHGTEEVRNRVGAWVWAVLSKMPDRGEMDGDEMARLRQFANSVIEDGSGERSFAEYASGLLLGEVGENEIQGMLDAVKKRVLKSIEQTEDEEATEVEGEACELVDVIADMVLTIVGEVYGQRDLLEHRRSWPRDPTLVAVESEELG